MPPEKHALLGASSAHRWLNCPGSARLTEDMPDSTSPYAEAGHLAHEIAELKARNYFIETLPKRSFNAKLKKLKESEHYDRSMDGATDEYLEHLKARAMTYPAAPTVALEVQVDFSDIVPEGFGTADCIMIGSGRLDVVDYKNGAGVLVEAEGNPQMMLYAWGAVRYFRPIFGNSIETIHILDRVSCWCCKNKNRKELKAIYQYLPHYWSLLKELQAQIPIPMKPYSRKGVPYGNLFDLEKVFEREIREEHSNTPLKGKRRRHEAVR